MDVRDIKQLLAGCAPHSDLAVTSSDCHQGRLNGVGSQAVDKACKTGQGVELPASVKASGNKSSVLSNSVGNPVPGYNAEEVLEVVPVHHRELTFLERILCTYGPVAHRQAEVTIDPVTGPVGDQVVLNYNRLTVRQMGKPRGKARPVEMEAIGESLVTGEGFRASGHRMTYTTGKELFVLEGADGTYAQLLRQTQGAPPSNLTAQKIYFWRSENRVQMDGIRLFNGNLPPAEEGK